MKEKNIDLFRQDDRKITVCGKEIIIKELSVGETFKIMDHYQECLAMVATKDKATELLTKKDVGLKFSSLVLDMCLQMINEKFNIWQPRTWVKKITKKDLMNKLSAEQLEAFIDFVLEPIIGEEAQKKTAKVTKMVGLH